MKHDFKYSEYVFHIENGEKLSGLQCWIFPTTPSLTACQ